MHIRLLGAAKAFGDIENLEQETSSFIARRLLVNRECDIETVAVPLLVLPDTTPRYRKRDLRGVFASGSDIEHDLMRRPAAGVVHGQLPAGQARPNAEHLPEHAHARQLCRRQHLLPSPPQRVAHHAHCEGAGRRVDARIRGEGHPPKADCIGQGPQCGQSAH